MDDRTINLKIARELLEERMRQINVEKFTSERDFVVFSKGELAHAAACYAVAGAEYPEFGERKRRAFLVFFRLFWPWQDGWWKVIDRRRCLVKAGALIIAAIQALDKQSGKAG